MTLLELLVTTAIFAIVAAAAVPHSQRGRFALWQANEMLLSDLRKSRADALTKGDHFIFKVTGTNTYGEWRMKLAGGVWAISGAPIFQHTLPGQVVFTAGWTSGVGATFEFNTRGLLVTPGAAASLRIYDGLTMLTNQITVWPSGQVAPI